jgi:hypothetical protein
VEEERQLALEKRRQAVGLRGRGGHVMGGGGTSATGMSCASMLCSKSQTARRPDEGGICRAPTQKQDQGLPSKFTSSCKVIVCIFEEGAS